MLSLSLILIEISHGERNFQSCCSLLEETTYCQTIKVEQQQSQQQQQLNQQL